MFFRYLEINFCLIFSVKLENGHAVKMKVKIIVNNGKIKINHYATPEVCFLMSELVEACLIIFFGSFSKSDENME